MGSGSVDYEYFRADMMRAVARVVDAHEGAMVCRAFVVIETDGFTRGSRGIWAFASDGTAKYDVTALARHGAEVIAEGRSHTKIMA